VQDSGYRVQGSGFRVQGTGYRVQGSGFMAWGFAPLGPNRSLNVSLVRKEVRVSGINVRVSEFWVSGSLYPTPSNLTGGVGSETCLAG